MKKAKAVSAIAISFFITALIYLCHTPVSIAMSRMGTASITDVEGIPCFSIPENFETRNGLPLYGIFINELPSGEDHDSLPHSIWSFRATDYNALPKIFPKHCIPFGDSPNGTTQRTLESLQLLKVYSVYYKQNLKDQAGMDTLESSV